MQLLNADSSSQDKALEYVYQENRDRVYSYVMANSGDLDQAKDIYQETVIAFFENVRDGKFKLESSISTYLFSIAKFKWLNELKKNKQIEDRHLKVVREEHDLDASQLLMKREDEQKIMDLFDLIGESCKKLLIQTVYFNASMKEIVDLLGFSNEQVARNKKFKCIKKLRILLKSKPEVLQLLRGYGV